MTREDHVIPYPRASRDDDTAHEQAASAETGIVPDMNMVVEFGPGADDRIADTAAIDTAVGTDLDVILDSATTDMGNGMVPLPIGDEAEAGSTQHRAGFDVDPFADVGAAIADHMRIEHAVVSDPDARFEHDTRREDDPVAQHHALAQHHMRTERNVGAESAPCPDANRRIDSRRRARRRKESSDDTRNGPRRVAYRDPGRRPRRLGREIERHQHRPGATRDELLDVLGRCQERKRIAVSPIERAHGVELHGSIPFEAAPDELGNGRRGQGPRGTGHVSRGAPAPIAAQP